MNGQTSLLDSEPAPAAPRAQVDFLAGYFTVARYGDKATAAQRREALRLAEEVAARMVALPSLD